MEWPLSIEIKALFRLDHWKAPRTLIPPLRIVRGADRANLLPMALGIFLQGTALF